MAKKSETWWVVKSPRGRLMSYTSAPQKYLAQSRAVRGIDAGQWKNMHAKGYRVVNVLVTEAK